jgi:hypothetical protein
MAVVQISRIQIRRGKKEGGPNADWDGIRQGVSLASGEMAWCLDSQQLYIGGGLTNEGAPPREINGVVYPKAGNIEILTERSNLLDAAIYRYKNYGDLLSRPLQNRLDERVNAESFGVVPVGSTPRFVRQPANIDTPLYRTKAIQSAINKLYLNSLQGLVGEPSMRAILEFGPGVYEFNSPIYIHSFTHIVGAGPKRTIFKYTGTGSAFILTNDDTYMDDSSVPHDSTDRNQCRSVILKNFSIQLDSNNANALLLDSVKDSEFTNIELSSSWHEESVPYENSKAIDMLATNDLITCSNNLFNNLRIFNFRIGINAQGDINSNTIQNCTFSTKDNTNSLEVGINFGKDINISLLGQKYGPRNNVITDCVFNRIGKQGIKIYNGTGNVSSQNRFTMVGDQYGGNDDAKYGNIEFDVDGNMTSQDLSDRHQLSAPGTTSYATPYISEVIGKSNYSNFFTNTINLQYITTPVKLFRLPVSRPCHLEVEYLYQSTNQRRLRRGKLSIVVNTNDLDTGGLPKLEMIDDYDYFGLGMSEQFTYEDIHLIFSASIRKYTVELVNSYTMELRYKYDGENTQSLGDQAKLTYTYKILS